MWVVYSQSSLSNVAIQSKSEQPFHHLSSTGAVFVFAEYYSEWYWMELDWSNEVTAPHQANGTAWEASTEMENAIMKWVMKSRVQFQRGCIASVRHTFIHGSVPTGRKAPEPDRIYSNWNVHNEFVFCTILWHHFRFPSHDILNNNFLLFFVRFWPNVAASR